MQPDSSITDNLLSVSMARIVAALKPDEPDLKSLNDTGRKIATRLLPLFLGGLSTLTYDNALAGTMDAYAAAMATQAVVSMATTGQPPSWADAGKASAIAGVAKGLVSNDPTGRKASAIAAGAILLGEGVRQYRQSQPEESSRGSPARLPATRASISLHDFPDQGERIPPNSQVARNISRWIEQVKIEKNNWAVKFMQAAGNGEDLSRAGEIPSSLRETISRADRVLVNYHSMGYNVKSYGEKLTYEVKTLAPEQQHPEAGLKQVRIDF